jgi:hypothetical protein
VEAELQARGLPHRYDGPEMIHTDDPEGYRVQPASLVAVFPGGGNAENVENLGEEDRLKEHLRKTPRPNYATFVASCMNHISHHIGYSIENFDAAKVEAVLKRRGLSPKTAGP